MRLPRFLTPTTVVSAHCDLPCGVYDPAQARIEAQSVLAMQKKYQANEDPVFRTRALVIIHERAGLAKHHLAVLWHDYFKPEHFEKYPQLHDLINKTIKAASGTGARGKVDPASGQELLDGIDAIAQIFWETKGKEYVVPQSADQA
jgi:nickel superoxide dismutase